MTPRIEFLTKKYRKKILDHIKNLPETSYLSEKSLLEKKDPFLSSEENDSRLVEAYITFLSKIDPTKKQSRTEAIIRWALEDTPLKEDLYKITQVFQDLQTTRFSGDPCTYKNYKDFIKDFTLFQNTKQKSKREEDKDYAEKMKQESILIEDTPYYQIYSPLTEEASCYWGRGTKWCTSATSSDNLFEYYNTKGPLFVVIEKKQNKDHIPEKYQFHKQKQQFMDIYDSSIDFETQDHLFQISEPGSFLEDALLEWQSALEKTEDDTKSEFAFVRKLEKDLGKNHPFGKIIKKLVQNINSDSQDTLPSFAEETLSIDQYMDLSSALKESIQELKTLPYLYKSVQDYFYSTTHAKDTTSISSLVSPISFEKISNSVLKYDPSLYSKIPPSILTGDDVLKIALEKAEYIGHLDKSYITQDVIKELSEKNPEYLPDVTQDIHFILKHYTSKKIKIFEEYYDFFHNAITPEILDSLLTENVDFIKNNSEFFSHKNLKTTKQQAENLFFLLHQKISHIQMLDSLEKILEANQSTDTWNENIQKNMTDFLLQTRFLDNSEKQRQIHALQKLSEDNKKKNFFLQTQKF